MKESDSANVLLQLYWGGAVEAAAAASTPKGEKKAVLNYQNRVTQSIRREYIRAKRGGLSKKWPKKWQKI
jgi:hypothetical protein